jgi:hypothetical protein
VIQSVLPLHKCADLAATTESAVEPLHFVADSTVVVFATEPLQSVANSTAASVAPTETSCS